MHRRRRIYPGASSIIAAAAAPQITEKPVKSRPAGAPVPIESAGRQDLKNLKPLLNVGATSRDQSKWERVNPPHRGYIRRERPSTPSAHMARPVRLSPRAGLSFYSKVLILLGFGISCASFVPKRLSVSRAFSMAA